MLQVTDPNGDTYEWEFRDFDLEFSQSATLKRITTKGQRNMNWLAIIGLIVQFLLGRILPGAASFAAQRGRNDTKQIRVIATAMVAAEPQLNFDCLMNVLPNFLEKLAALVKEKGFYDYAEIVNLVLTSLVELIRCQMTASGQSVTPQLEADIVNKLMTCGIKWGFHFFTTKDAAGSISGFLSCVLGGSTNPPNPPGGDNGGTTPPPGGINPERPPTFKATPRCP